MWRCSSRLLNIWFTLIEYEFALRNYRRLHYSIHFIRVCAGLLDDRLTIVDVARPPFTAATDCRNHFYLQICTLCRADQQAAGECGLERIYLNDKDVVDEFRAKRRQLHRRCRCGCRYSPAGALRSKLIVI